MVRCSVFLVAVLAACRAPLPNPAVAGGELRELAPERVLATALSEPREEAVAPAPVTVSLAHLAGGEWVGPIRLDLPGGWAASGTASSVRSPLWMPSPRPADGVWPVPPGRHERESTAAALIISLALFFSAPWTLGGFMK